MDPLSDVLSLLNPRSYMAGGLEAGGDWSIGFPRHEGVKCYAVVSGQCWLAVDGVAEPARLSTGDCFLLPGGRAFRLASDLDLAPLDFKIVYGAQLNGAVASLNGGGELFLVGGHFVLGGGDAGGLLAGLPPIIHIRTQSGRTALRWCLEQMSEELRERRPGGALVSRHLAHMMMVQALRLHLAEEASGGVGWLFALADRRMSAAIGAMHEDPARRWSLQELARRAGMSRSSFALRFKETVGSSPMEYLTRWRMLLAGDRLISSSEPISNIARSLGYDSDSAFSTAFKRVMGASPRRHARRPGPGLASGGVDRLEAVSA